MPRDYLDLFLRCLDTPKMFFDREKAEEEAEKARKQGKQAELYRERDRWTLFVYNKLNLKK